MADDVTSIQVKEETWKRLMMRKSPGDTFDDVVRDLLDIAEEAERDSD